MEVQQMCASWSLDYTAVKEPEEQRASWNSSFRKLLLFLNIILEFERKNQYILHPKSPRSVDRRALCSTDLCRDTESLIFIQQDCPGLLANVIMLFPSYMQHFPVIAQSRDQTVAQSDNAHSNHWAGLSVGRAMGIHCVWTDFGVHGILGSGTPHPKVLPTFVWCTIFMQMALCH